MVDLPGPSVLAVLTRAPSGGGKSRLFEALGLAPDPALLSALLLDTIDGARLPGMSCVAVVDPKDACDEVRAIVPADVRVVPQSTGSLGDRMREAMADLFANGAAIVVLIGSDLPDITPVVIAAAVSHLTRDPESVVLGPAADGGYYLIAATRAPDVFDTIEWGSPRVLEQTRAAAARVGLRVHLVDVLRDCDASEDLWSATGRRTRMWVDHYRSAKR